MICAGIDAGSRAIKAALIESDSNTVLARAVSDQGVSQQHIAHDLYERTLKGAGVTRDDVSAVVATGYGRHGITFASRVVTEITCHARGVRHFLPDTRTIIDIGGQDSKIIRLDDSGTVQDFSMNDRCAAGTGCFLEVVSRRLEIPLEGLGDAAGRSSAPSAISSTCVVFAETEIIGLLASGTAFEDIIAGVQRAIASRVASMAGRNIGSPLVFTGGVAMIPGMADTLSSVLGIPVSVSPDPQMTGAIGAALSGIIHR